MTDFEIRHLLRFMVDQAGMKAVLEALREQAVFTIAVAEESDPYYRLSNALEDAIHTLTKGD